MPLIDVNCEIIIQGSQSSGLPAFALRIGIFGIILFQKSTDLYYSKNKLFLGGGGGVTSEFCSERQLERSVFSNQVL